MAKESISVGLDIGTSKIRTVVIKWGNGSPRFQVIGIGQADSMGLRRSSIIDVEEVVKNIEASVKEAERTSGLPIEKVYVNLGGSHIAAKPSKGVVVVSRADNEVSVEDVDRAINAASAISVLPNREIIHVIPRNFILDNQNEIKNPVGMTGMRLEVEALIVEGSTPSIKTLTKCVNEAGLQIKGVVVSSLAASRAVLSKRQKELGALLLDLGGGTTDLTVFEEGDIIHSCILPVGSLHITNDIAIGLRTDIDLAERVKLEYGSALASEIGKKDKIDLAKLSATEKETVSRLEVAKIIEARLREILELTNKELKRIDRQGLLPAGVVLVGGGAKMPGLVDLVKEELALPAQIGFPLDLEVIPEKADDPAYATAIGLALWGMDEGLKQAGQGFALGPSSLASSIVKMKKWLRGFLP